MEKKKIGINFELSFSEIEDINPSFARGKVRVAYTGRNRNLSDISKDVFEEAMPSLFYCPLVGRYDPEADDFGSHDIQVVRNKEGGLQIENATSPFGVVFAGSQPEWVSIIEADGTEREYLQCDVILWKRQYGYDCLSKQADWHQSMEIAVEAYHIDADGYFVVEKMHFEALCILGNAAEPCFESASVQMMSGEAATTYRQQFSLMMDEMKTITGMDMLAFNSKNDKGGNHDLKLTDDIRDSVLTEYGLTMDAITFEVTEDMDETAFRAALDSMKVNEKPKMSTFAATYKQKREAISNALTPVVSYTGDGEIAREVYYWLSDFDDQYAYVERSTYENGDYNSDYGRFPYSWDEKELSAAITGDFEEMILQWLTLDENEKLQQSRQAFENLGKDFEAYKLTHSVEDAEVEALRQFKAERLTAEHKAEIDAVLEEFEDLAEREEYAAFTADENKAAYDFEDVDALKKELYAIRGKYAAAKFSKKNTKTSVKVPIGEAGGQEAPSRYGDLFAKYG